MIKKIVCGALACLCVASFAGCGATKSGNNSKTESSTPVETRPEQVKEIKPDIATSEYAYYVPTYDWVNTESGDTINFENSGYFNGTVNGKEYNGQYTLKANPDVLGRVDSNVTLDGDEEKAGWTIDFKTTCEIYVTTADGNREYFAAKWWLDKGNKPESKTDATYKLSDKLSIGYYYDFLTQKWTDKENGNTFTFNLDGTFEGKIKSKEYKGTYKIGSFGKNAETLMLAINRNNKGSFVTYTAKFDKSKKLTLTTDKGKSESYEAK